MLNCQTLKLSFISQCVCFFAGSMNGAMKASEGGTFEALYYKKNGHAIWLQIEITPIRNEQAVVVLFLSTYRDITIFKGRKAS